MASHTANLLLILASLRHATKGRGRWGIFGGCAMNISSTGHAFSPPWTRARDVNRIDLLVSILFFLGARSITNGWFLCFCRFPPGLALLSRSPFPLHSPTHPSPP